MEADYLSDAELFMREALELGAKFRLNNDVVVIEAARPLPVWIVAMLGEHRTELIEKSAAAE